MNVDITQPEAALLISLIEKTPVVGLEVMKSLLLLACKLQDVITQEMLEQIEEE